VKVEAPSSQSKRGLQVLGETCGTSLEILCAKPEMLVENAFETAIENRAHDLLDRAFPRQRLVCTP
jgi:hypothetical protein